MVNLMVQRRYHRYFNSSLYSLVLYRQHNYFYVYYINIIYTIFRFLYLLYSSLRPVNASKLTAWINWWILSICSAGPIIMLVPVSITAVQSRSHISILTVPLLLSIVIVTLEKINHGNLARGNCLNERWLKLYFIDNKTTISKDNSVLLKYTTACVCYVHFKTILLNIVKYLLLNIKTYRSSLICQYACFITGT